MDSMRCVRLLASVLMVMALTFGVAGGAAAQGYGEDPPRSATIGTGVASVDGEFRASYTAPDEIADTYLIYVVGTDADGEPFEWIAAQVTPAFAGLTWSLGGANLQPGSDFILEARYEDGTDIGAQVLGIQQLPTTGGDARSVVGMGIVLTVVGGALLYGTRLGRRYPSA